MSRVGFNGTRISRRSFIAGAAVGAGGLGLATKATRAFAQSKVDILSWCVAGPRFEPPQKALIALFQSHIPTSASRSRRAPREKFTRRWPWRSLAAPPNTTRSCTTIPSCPPSGRRLVDAARRLYRRRSRLQEKRMERCSENVLNLWSYKGKQYGLPPDGNTQLMYWRSDILNKAGVKPPETWDDVIEAAKELTGGDQYGFVCSLQRGIWDYSVFASILQSHGGQVYDPATFKVTLDSEPAIKALNVLKTLLKYADPVTLNASNDDVIRSFASGRGVLAPCEWGGAGFTSTESQNLQLRPEPGKCQGAPGPTVTCPGHGRVSFQIPIACSTRMRSGSGLSSSCRTIRKCKRHGSRTVASQRASRR